MKSPWLSLLGLALLVPIVALVPLGSVSVQDAAIRAGVLMLGLVVVDRMVLPMGRLLVEFVSPVSGDDDEDRDPAVEADARSDS